MNPARANSQRSKITTTTPNVIALQGGGNDLDRYSIPTTSTIPTMMKIIHCPMIYFSSAVSSGGTSSSESGSVSIIETDPVVWTDAPSTTGGSHPVRSPNQV